MKEKSPKKLADVNSILAKKCAAKKKKFKPCDNTASNCGCEPGAKPSSKNVDLVVLIDSSSTMQGKPKIVSDAAAAAIKAAVKQCKKKVNITWLWVDRTEPGSSPNHSLGGNLGNFSQSHQVYLENLGVVGPFYHDIFDSTNFYQPQEKGAAAITDLCKFFNWSKDSCRSILYISDTIIHGYGSSLASNDWAVNQAVAMANSNNVTVFAHRCDPYTGMTFGGISVTDCDQDYHNLCAGTGGKAITGGTATKALYEQLIRDAICDCGRGCKRIVPPNVKPCINISWGDGKRDCFETDDFETLCISVCNCYSNVAFFDFAISHIELCDSQGKPIPSLPNGTPSVEVVPLGPICFGDIPPCTYDNASCVSREIAVRSCGAKPGKYKIKLHGVCYQIAFDYAQEACFEFELTNS